MESFSSILTRIVGTQHGAKAAFARKTGLFPIQVTEYTNDGYLPELPQMEKILKVVTKKEAKELILAFVRESIPEQWRSVVKVSAR